MVRSQFSITWDAYQKNICTGLSALQQKGEFVDMTISADGHHVKVHQMVLSLISPYIKELIKSAQCPHPVIFLNRVSYQTLQSILEYAYTGEVLVTQDGLNEFLETCRALHIRGLENLCQAQDDNTLTVEESNSSTSNDDIFETEDIYMKEVDHSDDDDDDDDNSKINTRSQRKAVVNTNTEANTPKAQPCKIQYYTVSTQGFLQVVINRFIYSLRHTRKNKERFWRCIHQQRVACPAIVATKDDKVLERTGTHNHPFHKKQITERIQNGNMFTNMNKAERAAQKKRNLILDNRNAKDPLYIS